MTLARSSPAVDRQPLPRPDRWHRPLIGLALGIYSVSLAWLIGQAHRLRRLADGLGTVIVIALVLALVGMGLAFLMTTPSDQQLADFQGVAGAHAVGVADGGAGLPLLGWSTQGGDLRIPHFLGMHALQAIPLGLLGLELLSRGAPVLRGVRVRFRLVLIGSTAFAAMLGVLTWQALSGESIVHPSGPVLAAGAVVAIGAAAAVAAVVVVEHRSLRSRAQSSLR